jgi:hypothetical protein
LQPWTTCQLSSPASLQPRSFTKLRPRIKLSKLVGCRHQAITLSRRKEIFEGLKDLIPLRLTAQLPHFGHWVQVVRCCSHRAFDCLNLASAYPMSCITARICTPDSSWLVRSLLVMSCPRGLLLPFKVHDDDLHAHSPLIGQCRHG